MPATESTNDSSSLSFDLSSEDTLLVRLTGEWKLANRLPVADEVVKRVDAGPKIRRITFDTEGLQGWDSGLLIFLIKLQELASQGRTITVDQDGLSPGIKRLLSLASAVPERKGARRGGSENIFSRQTGRFRDCPMEFLVLPRMLALFLMMPLLSLYADLMGILGGLVIGVSMLNLNFMEYFNEEIPVAGDAFERFQRAAGMPSSSVHLFLKA
jgi:hypothetical protein